MKNYFILILFVISFLTVSAQEIKNPHPVSEFYGMSASELIFSGGKVISEGTTLSNVVRFSAFAHFQRQLHYNFGNYGGFFTGLGVRNIGFINKLSVPNTGEVKLKQRSYSVGTYCNIKQSTSPGNICKRYRRFGN